MSTTPQPEGQRPAESPVPIQAVAPYASKVRKSSPGRFLLVLVLIVLLGSLVLNFLLAGVAGLSLTGALETDGRIHEKFFSHSSAASDKVVILPIEGIITEAEDGFVKRAIDRVAKDKDVKALVLRVDSPGGSVSGSDYILHHLKDMAKEDNRDLPIVVSMGGIAASGGYYVSMAVGETPDTIFAEPTCFTGSIGVIIPHYNVAGLMEKYGVADDSIPSHPLKEMGSPTKAMTEQERKIFQALVNDNFERFKAIIRSGRSQFKKDPAALDALATGQIYTADQAKQNGLIDRIGFVEDAVDRAIALAKLDKDKVKVVRYKPEVGLWSTLMGGQSRSSSLTDLRALLEMTTPRAYYLCTWLPGLGPR
jgi:protease-4